MPEKLTLDRIDVMLRKVFEQLKAMGGRARGTEVLNAIEPKLNLSAFEKEKTRTGAVRWNTHIRFYTTDCVKAGFLQKSDGVWILTDEGEKALKLPAGELVRTANRAYRKSAKNAETQISNSDDVSVASDAKAERHATYEQAKETSRIEIDDYLDEMDPYDFQDLVAALLAAMGYHIRRVARRGADGGVDIVGYRDPLGIVAPRIYVQVKHRDQAVTVQEVRELEAVIRRDGDIGLIVSSGGFTAEANRELRSSLKHIDTMDQDRLIMLWQEHYEQLNEAGKLLLPLVRVYFLSPPVQTR